MLREEYNCLLTNKAVINKAADEVELGIYKIGQELIRRLGGRYRIPKHKQFMLIKKEEPIASKSDNFGEAIQSAREDHGLSLTQ